MQFECSCSNALFKHFLVLKSRRCIFLNVLLDRRGALSPLVLIYFQQTEANIILTKVESKSIYYKKIHCDNASKIRCIWKPRCFARGWPTLNYGHNPVCLLPPGQQGVQVCFFTISRWELTFIDYQDYVILLVFSPDCQTSSLGEMEFSWWYLLSLLIIQPAPQWKGHWLLSWEDIGLC